MEDIRLAMGLIGFLSVGAFLLTWRLLKGRSHAFLDACAVVNVGLVFAYMYFVWGELWIVRYIPLPSVIILSNWFPILLGSLGAIVWRRMENGPAWRPLPIMAVIVGGAIYSLTFFVPQEPPECGNKWVQPAPGILWPLCLQTTNETCSAAAAATVLNTIGIESNEQEMAELCLTKSGTTWLGLYHGLSTKLYGEKQKVGFFEGSMEELDRMSKTHPLLLCCELTPDMAERVPQYVVNGGWIPGTAHTVVYFGQKNGMHLIGDPSVGYEVWRDQDLQTLWTGTGLHLSGEAD